MDQPATMGRSAMVDSLLEGIREDQRAIGTPFVG